MYTFQKASVDTGRRIQQQKNLAERKRLTTGLNLQPGTKVIRGRLQRGQMREYKDEVLEITPDWRIRVKGLTSPIHPSLIIRVLE